MHGGYLQCFGSKLVGDFGHTVIQNRGTCTTVYDPYCEV